MRQLLSLVNLDVSLEHKNKSVKKKKKKTVEILKYESIPNLEVLEQASAGDLTAIDFLHVNVARTQEPGHQNLQVANELAVDL